MARPPMHALQGFVAAARSGNLSRAAESMHLTVSALSHQMRGLEERLDRRLFVRGPRGITLTADGEQLLERIGPHLDAIEHALRPFAARRDDVLTLSAMPSMASAWLLPRLSGLLAAHPQLEINLQSTSDLVDFARESEVDAALRGGSGRWPGVVIEHLFDEWLAPVASPALVARMGGLPSLRDLYRWPLLGDPNPRYWGEWFARFGGHAPSRYMARFDDSETLHRAAVEGVGVALARLTRVRLLIENGLLVALTPERLKTDYAHYLVYPARSSEHRGLQVFRDWLHAEAKRYAIQADAPVAPPKPPRARAKRGARAPRR